MPSTPNQSSKRAIVIGGGPAGLMAAEQLLNTGIAVELFDAMPSVGRKFLLAGIGGMNITHSEAFAPFCRRYREHENVLTPMLEQFGAEQLRAWIHELGIETFVGSSGRVFPTEMKAAPLLRAWLTRLKKQGLVIHTRHRWLGWQKNTWLFESPVGKVTVDADVVVLALGGGSWKKLGSDGAWQMLLQQRGVELSPLRPANCGFMSQWSEHLKSHFAGAPIKQVIMKTLKQNGELEQRRGEFVLTEHGVEGSLVYAHSATIRDTLEQTGSATIWLDLAPDRDAKAIEKTLSASGKKSVSNRLKTQLGLDGGKCALLFEQVDRNRIQDAHYLAEQIKHLPIVLHACTDIDEAISTAGGVTFDAMNEHLMLHAMPGVFCAGEMLDWEAPTGGYLLTACFSTGRWAGLGAQAYWQKRINH